ncbi:hypothetical protein Shyhy01_67910 [Streptomyces hygroscopicus subsp. hygroscopicus]|nr:hypothetical protein Shyhy01_67910 [Streptomyces hygroscopicus subsp. hygroscopicus]
MFDGVVERWSPPPPPPHAVSASAPTSPAARAAIRTRVLVEAVAEVTSGSQAVASAALGRTARSKLSAVTAGKSVHRDFRPTLAGEEQEGLRKRLLPVHDKFDPVVRRGRRAWKIMGGGWWGHVLPTPGQTLEQLR